MIDVIYPNRLACNESIVALSYDYENNLVYITTNTTIYMKKLDSKEDPIQLLKYDQNEKIFAVAYDWMSRNIYVSSGSPSAYRIIVHHFPVGKKGVAYKKSIANSNISTKNNYDSLGVDPVRGYLHYAASNESLMRTDLGSVNRTRSSYNNARWFPKFGISIDIYENKMYWPLRSDTRILRYNLDKGNAEL